MNDWAKLVKKVYAENKKKAGYMLKDAMRDAKKIYKPVNGKTTKKHHKKSAKKHHKKRTAKKHRK
jgi:hypothetical protein